MVSFDDSSILARRAIEIMLSDRYLDLLEIIYSAQDTMVEFETNPRQSLIRGGIRIPDAIEVVIHHPGTIGRPGRVDFHLGRAGTSR